MLKKLFSVLVALKSDLKVQSLYSVSEGLLVHFLEKYKAAMGTL